VNLWKNCEKVLASLLKHIQEVPQENRQMENASTTPV
jgi:hypothetical protein